MIELKIIKLLIGIIFISISLKKNELLIEKIFNNLKTNI